MNMIDRNLAAYCLCCLALAVTVFCVSAFGGSGSMFYGAGPVASIALLLFLFVVGGSEMIASQVASRMDRDKVQEAILFERSAMTVHVIVGLILVLVTVLAGDALSEVLFGSRYASLTLYALMPCMLFGLAIGPLKGFLDGTGYAAVSRAGLYLFAGVTGVAAGFLAHIGHTRGQEIALLLLNDRYGAVYTAAGLGLAISAGSLISFLFLLVMEHHVARTLERNEAVFGVPAEEEMQAIIPYYVRKMLPSLAAGLIPFLVWLLDYRIGLHMYGGADRTGFGLHWWDGYAGVAFPVIAGMSAFVLIFFSRMPVACAGNYLAKKHKSLRIRYSMMLRLSSYVSIPVSAFLFGAAKPIVQIAHLGLNQQARESAILTLKLGSFDVFLITTAILLAVFFWKSGYESVVLLSGACAYFIQIMVLFLFMHVLTISIKALPLALGAFCLAYIVISVMMTRNSLLRRCENSWALDNVMVVLSAAAADIPVLLLNDFMTDEIIPVGGVILLLMIFVVLYVIFSLLLHAVDLHNVDRIPGGKYIRRAAELFGLVRQSK